MIPNYIKYSYWFNEMDNSKESESLVEIRLPTPLQFKWQLSKSDFLSKDSVI